MVGVHHDVTELAHLPHVGPGVAAAPGAATTGTLEVTKHPTLALVGCFLRKSELP